MDAPEVTNLLLVVSRAPVPGQTKTRLGARIGMEAAALLHRAFLIDFATRFASRPDERPEFHLGWSYAPADTDFAAILRDLGCLPSPADRFLPQPAASFDQRQADALRRGHALGYARTVLVGADSPHLSRQVARDAFAALLDHDVVMMRVRDGGYCLIGTTGSHEFVTGVEMSAGAVADAVLDRARSRGLRVAELAPSFDVDEIEDLALLIAALAPDGTAAPATWAALATLGLRPLGARDADEEAAMPRADSPVSARR